MNFSLQAHGLNKLVPAVFLTAGLAMLLFFGGTAMTAHAASDQPVTCSDTEIADAGNYDYVITSDGILSQYLNANGPASSDKQSLDLSAGTYELAFFGWDSSLESDHDRSSQNQPIEKWFLRFSGDGYVYDSPSTDDLQDETQLATNTTYTTIELSQPTTEVQARHHAHKVDGPYSANSLSPECVGINKQEESVDESNQCTSEATLTLSDSAESFDGKETTAITEVNVDDTTVSSGETYETFTSGDITASNANTADGTARIERTESGFKLFLDGVSATERRGLKGSIQLSDADLSSFSTSTSKNNDGSDGNYTDTFSVNASSSTVDFDLQVGSGEDSFTVSGLEESCEVNEEDSDDSSSSSDDQESSGGGGGDVLAPRDNDDSSDDQDGEVLGVQDDQTDDSEPVEISASIDGISFSAILASAANDLRDLQNSLNNRMVAGVQDVSFPSTGDGSLSNVVSQ